MLGYGDGPLTMKIKVLEPYMGGYQSGFIQYIESDISYTNDN